MKLAFDIGYNHGEFTKRCQEQYPNCRVVAVEANPDLFYDNKFKNENFTLIHALASSVPGKLKDFYIEPSQDGISTASEDFLKNSRFIKGSKNLRPNSANYLPPIKVKTISLDEMVKEYGRPEMIKIDVEGYESEVLKGLSSKQGTICFEWHEEALDSLEEAIEQLLSIGYEEFGIIGYFEEVTPEKCTFSEQGDPYLVEPDEYFTWEEIELELGKVCDPARRVNYGMCFCR